MEKWKEYFMKVMVGVEGRVRMEEEKRKMERKVGEKGLGLKETRKAIKEIKVGKAMGVDEIPGETWKYGIEEVEKWIWSFCNRTWKREGWPEGWKEGLIVPIVKKGEGDRV